MAVNVGDIQSLLNAVGMPSEQQTELCALTILAMANLEPSDNYVNASNNYIRIHDVIKFLDKKYEIKYAENSRETFRKQAMHPFRDAALIEDNGRSTNSPSYRYKITDEFLAVIKAIGSGSTLALTSFMSSHATLISTYASKKKMALLPVNINSTSLTFSPGPHNELQKAIIEDFAPRFAPNSTCLYVGDTIKKDLIKEDAKLSELGFKIDVHDKMPDVVLYRAEEDWIYFIEAVDSVGPMSPARVRDIEAMTANVKSGKIYVTAFLDFSKFKKFSEQLAWETEVWIADMPEHMIHLNGDKFLGPRKKI